MNRNYTSISVKYATRDFVATEVARQKAIAKKMKAENPCDESELPTVDTVICKAIKAVKK